MFAVDVECGVSFTPFEEAIRRAREFPSVVCYHFATQLVSTARDEIERDDYRTV